MHKRWGFLPAVLIAAFAVPAWARTIYWDTLADDTGWQIDIDEADGENANPWAYIEDSGDDGGRFATGVFKLGGSGVHSVDSTLISNAIDISGMSNVSVFFDGVYQDVSDDPVDNKIYDFGVRPTTGDDVTVGSFFEEDEDGTTSGPFGFDLSEVVDGWDEVRFWWRFAASTTNKGTTYIGAGVDDVCLTADCPTLVELKNHTDVKSGEFAVPKDQVDYLVTCLPAREAGHYLRGLRTTLRKEGTQLFYYEVLFRSEGTPGTTPGTKTKAWISEQIKSSSDETTRNSPIQCEPLALDPIPTNENWCIGIQVQNHEFSAPYYVAYQDVGKGNSRSYIRQYDGEWESMDDKEFLFTALADADCDMTTTTTTVPSTTTTTTIPGDDDDDVAPLTVEIVTSSGEILPTTKDQFTLTLTYNHPVSAEAKADAPSLAVFSVKLPSAGYEFDENQLPTSPEGWQAIITPTDSETETAGNIRWEAETYSQDPPVGALAPGKSAVFSFTATADIPGTDGFEWWAADDADPPNEYTSTAYVDSDPYECEPGEVCNDCKSFTPDGKCVEDTDDDDDFPAASDDDDDDSSGCGI
ncbi:MAG: hypothetical protein H6684_14785 [Deltaproteobacteria bacterium]|nr:hypothetical protein [Deltaproteobacteria bacterium]